jgi:UDP-N-acetylglucosamine--N-acetylmuramyl-(pentapeptide) pyrophosphoryl-undecaprenol N-acetylglucosamine transferase
MALGELALDKRPVVRHQAGKNKDEATKKLYEKMEVDAEITPFIEDMAEAYEWADLVICRSGALTIAELAAAGLASVLVPYPSAVDDHQTENAKFLAEKGAAILAKQDELSQDALAQVLEALITNRDQLLDMSKKARDAAMPDATQKTAIICADIAGYPFQTHHEVLQEDILDGSSIEKSRFDGMEMGLGGDDLASNTEQMSELTDLKKEGGS